MKKLIFTFLLFAGIINFAYSQIITIDSVRSHDANYVPLLLNDTVTVKGVVTTHQEFGSVLVYFQVPTAGLVAYDATFCSGVTRGDSVQVTGKVVQYGGLTELQPVTAYTILAQNVTTPSPISLTPTQVRSGEQWEGQLIKINGVTAVHNTSGVSVTTWTVSSSGTNYRIFVGSDSCDIRIYATTNIAGTTIPAYPFNVVAVMSQYCTSSPYNTGYQILPRDLSDFTSESGGPTIAATPTESDITQTSVTLSFTTVSTGDTKVKYFVSDSIGQSVIYTDSVYNTTLTTSHSITLSNLKPAKIYYALVSSTNSTGTSTIVKYFSTASRTGSTGKIETYFNYAVDTSVALPNNKANGPANFRTRLIQRIDSATSSIDFAIYSFNDISTIYDHLISALIRGVKIRVVYDYRDGIVQDLMQQIINAGIGVMIRPSSSYIMHNKFFVFDGRDTNIAASKKWLWGGSANITTEQFDTDVQNVILIQDESLCNAYTREFEEMWGSHNDYKNASNAKFGSSKLDNTPHVFNINGKRVESYFSPSDDVAGKIVTLLDQTHKSVNFLIYDFTLLTIANKMKTKYNYPTRMVRGVFDRSKATGSDTMIYREMKGISGNSYAWDPPAKVFLENYSGLLHDKYMIIDADSLESSPVVETGSFNYTSSGNTGNDENVLFVYDSLIANQYYQDFVKRLTDAGGSTDVKQVSSIIPEKYTLEQNYPNPFNPSTTIRYSIPNNVLVILRVYDILGREIKTLVNQKQVAGKYEANLDMTGFASGIYIYKLQAGNFIDNKKMILIK
jgi:phosphatidylserine/phosphatidylglycerophosphate/cardiolipin synthase-like enzyme